MYIFCFNTYSNVTIEEDKKTYGAINKEPGETP